MLALFPERSAVGAAEGVRLSIETAIPSLLPFAVFSSCVIYSGAARVWGAACSKVFGRLFNVSPYGAAAFIVSLVGGYPTGVRAVCDTYEKGLIEKDEAERLLAFCNNSGAVFIIGAAGIGAFGSVKIGILLYLVHIAAAVFAGVLMRGKKRTFLKMSVREEYAKYRAEKQPLMYVLGKSLASAGGAMVNVCAAVIVFNSIAEVFCSGLPYLAGLIEMTRGVFAAGGDENMTAAAIFLSWGGLSVHAQAAAIASPYDLKMKYHTMGKIIAAIFAGVMIFILSSAV